METKKAYQSPQMMSDIEEVIFLHREEDLESEFPFAVSPKLYGNAENNGDSYSSSISIYSPIKPEDIRILDLHVDPELKPNYLPQSKSCVWLGNESSIEEKKLRGILRCLSNEIKEVRENQGLTRTSSYEHIRPMDYATPRLKRASVDFRLESRKLTQETSEYKEEVESSQLFEQSSVTRNSNNCDLPKARIIEGLEFQTSLKNERCHFMFADMLIENLEMMHSDEYYYQYRHGHNFKVDTTLCLTKTEPDRPRVDLEQESAIVKSPFNSSARSTTMTFIDHVMSILTQLSAHDGKQRTIPASLKTLCNKLEESCLLSLSLGLFRSQGRRSERQTRSSKVSEVIIHDDVATEAFEEKIKAAIGTYTIDLQVGGYPVLGPDMSLPNYIASRFSPDSKYLFIMLNVQVIPFRRTATLFLQQNKCPGCQCSFLPEIAIRLRLCKYFGLYFCSVCHSNTLMLIPASILTKWDFSMFPVCRPARDFLHLIHNLPVFSFAHFTKSLQTSLRVLSSVSRLRRQGRLLLDFITTCRQGSPLMTLSNNIPSHWFSDTPLLFSIADFQLMESGFMELNLKDVVSKYIEHVSICPVCQARGFFCELCDKSSEIIFPFEIDHVSQCARCGACFHSRCFIKSKTPCLRCERFRARELRSKQTNSPNIINTP